MASTRLTDAALARLAQRAGRRLLAGRRRIATAESCTGGWIAKALTDVAGSSEWFEEAFVTYSNRAKQRRLGVARRLLANDGAVSEGTVRAMARGLLRRSAADVAIAVSGIAGPGGAVPGKPVGTVWICWGSRRAGRTVLRSEVHRFRGDREAIRRSTVRCALRGLERS